MKHWIIVGVSFLIAESLHGTKLTPQETTIVQLELVLNHLGEYNFGEPETWKPELIEVMQSVYQQPEAQAKAASLMLTFLRSEASNEAKNAVRTIYYTLTGKASIEAESQASSIETSASSLMTKVAALHEDFESSTEPAEFIQQRLRNASDELRPHVIRLIRLLPESFRSGFSLFEVHNLTSHNKAQLLKLLSARGDPSIHALATDFAQSDNQMLRLAGLESLQTFGRPEDVLFLTHIAASREDPEKSLAREALYRMPGEDVDIIIIKLLKIESPQQQLELISAIEKRNIESATTQLLELVSKDGETQSPAIRALATTASLSSLGAVIELLIQADSLKQKKALETAIFRIASRYSSDSKGSTIIRKRLKSTRNSQAKDSLASILEKLKNAK